MYLRSTTFDTAAALIDGYDLATEGGLLVGFREWLVLRVGCRTNSAWWELARQCLHERLPPVSEKEAVRGLFELLDEFLYTRSAAREGGLEGIFVAHHGLGMKGEEQAKRRRRDNS